MNILLVSDVSIHNVIGGAERVLYEQSYRLAQKGHSVNILTRRLPDHESDAEIIKNIKESRFPIDQRNAITFLISTLQNSQALFESLSDKYSFDCINFHQPFSSLGVTSSSLSSKIKKIYTCHSLSHEEYQSRNKKPNGIFQNATYLLNIYGRKLIEKKVLNISDKIIVLSKNTQDKLWNTYRIPNGKVAVIPGGIDLERFHPAANRSKIRRRLGIPDEKMLLLTIRNLVPRMGLGNLILAMKSIIREIPDIFLIIGGDGPLKNELLKSVKELQLEDYIKFAGFIPEQDLPDYYRASDIFILPTLELEGFGLITLESLASGIPVLGTPVGGTKEILTKFNSSYLFNDSTPESMTELIVDTCRRFTDYPALWQDVSSQCRAFVEANYSWDKNVELTENIFMEPNRKKH